MNGQTLWNFLEAELKRREIRKAVFYEAIGITATAYYGWKNGAAPKAETVERIEKYLGVDLSEIEKSEQLEELRDDLRILLRSASDLPPSSVYALIAQIEKEKEQSVLPD